MTLPYSDVLVWHAAILLVVSFAVGVLGGFVGLALGTMRLPVLLLLGFDTTIAAGTNIAVSTASAATGAVRHFRDGRVDANVVLLVGVPSMAGAFAGGLASGNVPDSLLLLAVGVLVFWQGVELIARVRPRMQSEHPASDSRSLCDSGRRASYRRAAGAGVGMAVGLLGGAVGLILGSLRLPALIRVLEMQPRTAAGTNLAIGFLMGSVGWTGHVFQGHVDYPTVAIMGAAAVVGSYLGARLTGRVSLDRLLLTMGLVLLVVGPLLVWRAVGTTL